MSRNECQKSVICYVFVSLIFGYDFSSMCLFENEIFDHGFTHSIYISFRIRICQAIVNNILMGISLTLHASYSCSRRTQYFVPKPQPSDKKMTIPGNEHLFMTNPYVLYIALSQAGLGSPYVNQLVLWHFHRIHIFHPSIVILAFFHA